jgi:pimeloyl-ACP methyl ester carboxylesterase
MFARVSSKSDLTFESWRTRSNLIAAAAFADSAAGEFYEPWSGLTNWSSNTGIQVSSGRLYSAAGYGGSTSGINRAFALSASQSARVVIPFSFIPFTGSSALIIGVSSDTAGGVPASGGANAEGLYFSGQAVYSWNKGTSTSIVTGLTANQTYVGRVTITVDPNYVSVVAAIDAIAGTATTTEYRAQFARSNLTVNNIYLYNADSRLLTGNSVGPLVARQAISTSTRSYGIEAAGRNVHWTQATGPNGVTNNLKIVTPPGYDSRVPTPAVVMFHGNGSNENIFSDNAGQQPAYTAFLNAGYIMISSAYTAASSTWGAQASLDAYYAAAQYARDHYNISSIGFYANSMGGIESLLALAERRIPGVSWWVGMSATYSLLDNYTDQSVTTPFTSIIDTAYGDTAGTLSSAASAGATSISSSVSFAAGSAIMIDATGTNPEQVVTGTPSGSGPYTIPLVSALKYAHANAATVSNYPTKTAGYDPSQMDARAFRGVPMLVMASLDGTDVAVNQTNNSAALAKGVAAWSPELVVPPNITGGHAWSLGGAISGFSYSGATTYAGLMIAFANKYSGN